MEDISTAEREKEAGIWFQERKDYREAINRYTSAILMCSTQAPYWANRAECFLEIGEYVLAEVDCKMALEIAAASSEIPNSLIAKISCFRATAEMRQRKFTNAKCSLDRAGELDNGRREINMLAVKAGEIMAQNQFETSSELGNGADELQDLALYTSSDEQDDLEIEDSDLEDSLPPDLQSFASGSCFSDTNCESFDSLSDGSSSRLSFASPLHRCDLDLAVRDGLQPCQPESGPGVDVLSIPDGRLDCPDQATKPLQTNAPHFKRSDVDVADPIDAQQGDRWRTSQDVPSNSTLSFTSSVECTLPNLDFSLSGDISVGQEKEWSKALSHIMFGQKYTETAQYPDLRPYFNNHKRIPQERKKPNRGRRRCLPDCVLCWALRAWQTRFRHSRVQSVHNMSVVEAAAFAMELQCHVCWAEPEGILNPSNDVLVAFAKGLGTLDLPNQLGVVEATCEWKKIAEKSSGPIRPVTDLVFELRHTGPSGINLPLSQMAAWAKRPHYLHQEQRSCAIYLERTAKHCLAYSQRQKNFADEMIFKWIDLTFLAQSRGRRQALLFELAEESLLKFDFQFCKMLMDEVIANQNTVAAGWVYRSYAYLMAGNWECAREDAEQACKLLSACQSPNDNQNHRGLVEVTSSSEKNSSPSSRAIAAYLLASSQFVDSGGQILPLKVENMSSDAMKQAFNSMNSPSVSLEEGRLKEIQRTRAEPEKASLPQAQNSVTGGSSKVPEVFEILDEEMLCCDVGGCIEKSIDQNSEEGWAETICHFGHRSYCHKKCLRHFGRSHKKICPRDGCLTPLFGHAVFMNKRDARTKRKTLKLPPPPLHDREISKRNTSELDASAPDTNALPGQETMDHSSRDKARGSALNEPLNEREICEEGKPVCPTSSCARPKVAFEVHDKNFKPSFKQATQTKDKVSQADTLTEALINLLRSRGATIEGDAMQLLGISLERLKHLGFNSLSHFCALRPQHFQIGRTRCKGYQQLVIRLPETITASSGNRGDVFQSPQCINDSRLTQFSERASSSTNPRKVSASEENLREVEYFHRLEDFPDLEVAEFLASRSDLRQKLPTEDASSIGAGPSRQDGLQTASSLKKILGADDSAKPTNLRVKLDALLGSKEAVELIAVAQRNADIEDSRCGVCLCDVPLTKFLPCGEVVFCLECTGLALDHAIRAGSDQFRCTGYCGGLVGDLALDFSHRTSSANDVD